MTDYVGQQLGNYRLTRFLGRGSFAEVYLGEHVHLGTQAAIKVLTRHTDSPDDPEQFRREAKMVAQLAHPHIVRVLEFGVEGGTPFLVMEYAAQGTMRKRYPKGSRVPLETVIAYVKQAADALDYLHEEKRLVHRDIKPENLLLRSDQELWLSDFGIVVAAHTTGSLEVKDVMGTLPYMAPEQLAGKPRKASDQYALGIVVYEWLCGTRPFEGSYAEIFHQQQSEPPPPLREQVPSLSSEVERVVLQALAKDPSHRFPSVLDFVRALEQASQAAQLPEIVLQPDPELEQGPVVPASETTEANQSQQPTEMATPASGIPSSQQTVDEVPADLLAQPQTLIPLPNKAEEERVRQARQKPPPSRFPPAAGTRSPQGLRLRFLSWKATPLLLVLTLLILGSGVGLYTAIRISPPRTQATANVFLTRTAQSDATTTARGQATARAAAEAYARFVATNGIMFGFDAQHSHANPYEQILTPTTVGGLTEKWDSFIGSYYNVFSSSPAVAGGVVYVGSADGNVYALDTASGKKKWIHLIGSSISSSPAVAGGVVYIGSDDDHLYALEAASGKEKWASLMGGPSSSSPAVANGVVISSDDTRLYALDAASGVPKWTYLIGATSSSSPAVANGVVYIGSLNGHLYALEAASGKEKWASLTGSSIRSSPAVAGGVVYVGSDDGNVYALNATSGKKKWAYPTHGLIDSSPAVANDVVYVGSDDGNVYALDAVSGKKMWTYQTSGLIDSSPTVAGGVVYVGSDDGNVYALDAVSGKKMWAYPTRGPITSSPAVANGVVYVVSVGRESYNSSYVYAFYLPGT